ncbi:MAG: hypothetical protein M0032_02130 [Actinomycetota bacterium]|nr:hypothetical protein [Actinomycetota bacterium]
MLAQGRSGGTPFAAVTLSRLTLSRLTLSRLTLSRLTLSRLRSRQVVRSQQVVANGRDGNLRAKHPAPL